MDNKIEIYKNKATDYFKQGYNCAQSVVLAFSDMLNLDTQILAKLASPFGGGMGGMREVCGAASGMFLVLGILEGYSDPKAYEEKKELYGKVQNLAAEFKKQCGSIICGDLLKMGSIKPDENSPAQRNETYYKKRPCAEITGIATEILAKHLISE